MAYGHKGMVCVTRTVGGQEWGKAGGEILAHSMVVLERTSTPFKWGKLWGRAWRGAKVLTSRTGE